MSLHIIACGVFRDALKIIEPQRFLKNVSITYITPALHNYPDKLKKELLDKIRLAKKTGDRILCLYGRCYPDLDHHLNEMGVPKVPGEHCYEILIGSRRFNKILGEEAGTYFVEKELALNFPEYCIKPLELNDPQMKEFFFKNYKRLAYIRQPLDPDTVISSVHGISRLLKLKPQVIDADYSELKTNLIKLLSSFLGE